MSLVLKLLDSRPITFVTTIPFLPIISLLQLDTITRSPSYKPQPVGTSTSPHTSASPSSSVKPLSLSVSLNGIRRELRLQQQLQLGLRVDPRPAGPETPQETARPTPRRSAPTRRAPVVPCRLLQSRRSHTSPVFFNGPPREPRQEQSAS